MTIGNCRCLRFLWCEDLTCDWLQRNKHSRHILGVHANIITAVILINKSSAVFMALQVALVLQKLD